MALAFRLVVNCAHVSISERDCNQFGVKGHMWGSSKSKKKVLNGSLQSERSIALIVICQLSMHERLVNFYVKYGNNKERVSQDYCNYMWEDSFTTTSSIYHADPWTKVWGTIPWVWVAKKFSSWFHTNFSKHWSCLVSLCLLSTDTSYAQNLTK